MATTKHTYGNSKEEDPNTMAKLNAHEPLSAGNATTVAPDSRAEATTSDHLKASSAISELQAAFGSILLSRKDVNLPSPPIKPTWTGCFALFSFPRELRDRIYYHYLYRPSGVIHRRGTYRTFPFGQLEDTASLFLTCRQVYEEALQVFYRYNAIEISGRKHWKGRGRHGKALDGTLRLFPDKAGSLIQRVRKQYHEYMIINISYDYNLISQKPGDAFIQMLRDAYTFKDSFPRLRDFTIVWQAFPHFFETQENMLFVEKSSDDDMWPTEKIEEEKVVIWLTWMRKWIRDRNVVPPRWVRFEFSSAWRQNEMQRHMGALNEAYARLGRETAALSNQQAELEESGKKWLEETWAEDKKKLRRTLTKH